MCRLEVRGRAPEEGDAMLCRKFLIIIAASAFDVIGFSNTAHADQPERLEAFCVYGDFTLAGKPTSVGWS